MLLLTWITERFTTADVANNLLLLIETEHALRPHRDSGKTRGFATPPGFGDDEDDPDDEARRRAPEWEQEMLLLAARLQVSVQKILATLNGRSLNLTSERDQAGAFYATLVHLRRAIDMLPQGENDPPGPFSLRDLQRWQDRASTSSWSRVPANAMIASANCRSSTCRQHGGRSPVTTATATSKPDLRTGLR
ncbi:hypothetical protein [Nonomuraea sp. NPDC049400]|uniref:hypothetical protein n=1 Tax=Nonomuraea sp. NPDC049400 TaxID=3364352 RepID=UPI003794A890